MSGFGALSVLSGEGFVPFTRNRCITLVSAVPSIEFPAFKAAGVFHEETSFVVREFGKSRLEEAEGVEEYFDSEVLAYREEDVNGFLFDFMASSTASATRLRWMIRR